MVESHTNKSTHAKRGCICFYCDVHIINNPFDWAFKGGSNLHVFLNWSLNELFDWMYLHGIDFQGSQSQWVEGRLLWVLFICYLNVINSIKLW
jgi:hypothetical protein